MASMPEAELRAALERCLANDPETRAAQTAATITIKLLRQRVAATLQLTPEAEQELRTQKHIFQEVIANRSKRQRESATVDAFSAAVMRSHLAVFKEQFASLHKSLRTHTHFTGVEPLTLMPPDSKYSQNVNSAQPVGAMDVSQSFASVPVAVPDALEIKLANLLDESGGLAKAQQAESFLQLCAKATSPERQALLLSALQCTSGVRQLARLVQLGALKVLRGWLREATVSRHTQLAALLLDVLRELPVTEEAMRVSEIGKTVRKIRRQQDTAGTTAAGAAPVDSVDVELAARAESLIGFWMRTLKEQRNITTITETRKRPREALGSAADPGGALAEARRRRREAAVAAQGADGKDQKDSSHLLSIPSAKDKGDVLGSLMGTSAAPKQAPVPSTHAQPRRDRAKFRSNGSAALESNDSSTTGASRSSDEFGAAADECGSPSAADLPSLSLASFEAATGGATTPKKPGRRLRWADHEGRALVEKTEIVTEYMERAKDAADAAAAAAAAGAAAAAEEAAASDAQLSHSDRLRREREMEKAAMKRAHESDAREKASEMERELEDRRRRLRSMSSRCAWHAPRSLAAAGMVSALPELQPESQEVSQQSARTKHLMPVRYLQPRDIPPNPDSRDPSLSSDAVRGPDIEITLLDAPVPGEMNALPEAMQQRQLRQQDSWGPGGPASQQTPSHFMRSYGFASSFGNGGGHDVQAKSFGNGGGHDMQAKSAEENKAVEMCRSMAAELHLEMDIVAAELSLDWQKITFFYNCHVHINHRDLVQKLHAATKKFIWMKKL